MSALPPKADISLVLSEVPFAPLASRLRLSDAAPISGVRAGQIVASDNHVYRKLCHQRLRSLVTVQEPHELRGLSPWPRH
jgi:hypothetical protein